MDPEHHQRRPRAAVVRDGDNDDDDNDNIEELLPHDHDADNENANGDDDDKENISDIDLDNNAEADAVVHRSQRGGRTVPRAVCSGRLGGGVADKDDNEGMI